MIDLRQVGKRLEAWRNGVLIFNAFDQPFAIQQCFVRDGVVKLNGVALDRPRKQRRERMRRNKDER